MQFPSNSMFIVFSVAFFATLILPTLQWKSYEFNHGLADFTDMGSYSHGVQENIMEEVEGLTAEGSPSLKTRSCNCATGVVPVGDRSGGNTDVQALHYLKRVVSSLLHQMNVRGHIFGPQEAITIDLQAEILYEDFITLNDFLKSKSADSEKYLHRVDDIFSSLLHLSEASLACSVFENVQDALINFLKVVASVRTLFITLVSAIFTLVVAILTWKLWKSSSLISILKYGLVVVIVIGFAWEFYAHIEKAKAKNAARLAQTPEAPRDCNYDDLSVFETISYVGKQMLNGGTDDRCVQFYHDNMVDPIWNISPAAALAETMGNLSAGFTKAFTTVFPFWLRPIITLLLTLAVLFLSFMGIFGFKIRTPLVSIEPAGSGQQGNYRAAERRLSNGHPQPALEQDGASQKQVAEKSASEVVRVKTRDAGVDTSDFEEYLLMQQQQENEEHRIPEIAESSSTNPFWIWLQGSNVLARFLRRTLSTVMNIIDILLRRTPSMMLSRHVNHGRDEIW